MESTALKLTQHHPIISLLTRHPISMPGREAMAAAVLTLVLVLMVATFVRSNLESQRRRLNTHHERHREHRKSSCLQMKDKYQVVPLRSWGSLSIEQQKYTFLSSFHNKSIIDIMFDESTRTWTELQCDRLFTTQRLSSVREQEVNRSIEIEESLLEKIRQFPLSTEKRVIALCLVFENLKCVPLMKYSYAYYSTETLQIRIFRSITRDVCRMR